MLPSNCRLHWRWFIQKHFMQKIQFWKLFYTIIQYSKFIDYFIQKSIDRKQKSLTLPWNFPLRIFSFFVQCHELDISNHCKICLSKFNFFSWAFQHCLNNNHSQLEIVIWTDADLFKIEKVLWINSFLKVIL